MSGNPAGPDANCLPPGCFRYYYEFSLVPNNGYTGSFDVDDLVISAPLSVNGTIIATNPSPDLISEFNSSAIQACYNPLISGVLSPSEGEISFILSNDDNDPTTNDPPISISPGGQPFHLFTAVVDAFPGETIDLVTAEAFYSSGLNIGIPMTVLQTCGVGGVPTQVTFPAPSSCSDPGLCINLGPHSGGGENPALIPVFLKGVSSNYEEVDVMVDVSFDNLMEIPEIIAGDIPASDIEVFPNQSGGYSVYGHTRNVSPTGILFTIKLNGPMFLSSGGTAVLSVTEGRYEPGGETCCTPCYGPDETVVFTGFPDCVEDIAININGETQPMSQDCADMSVRVNVNWPNITVHKTFYKFTIVLDLDLQGDISILDIADNNLGCPTPTSDPNEPYFCGSNTCFEILDPNTIRYCFRTFADPQTASSGAGFNIKLKAEGGCVNGVTVREAYLSEVNGGPNTACVPDVNVNQSDFPLCSPMISGMAEREDGDKLKAYNVSISGDICNYNIPVNNCEANYAQCVCDPSDSYEIRPSKDGDYLNGVTTYDLVLISKHVLGVQLLDSPYKLIAADANNSGTVTTFDIVQLRKLILFVDTSFPNNTSWRFVDKSYVFPDPANPWEEVFPEEVNINQNAAYPIPNVDFIAIKVGDVNLSANTGDCFTSPGVDDRSMAEVPWETEVPTAMKTGEVVTLPFRYVGSGPLPAFQAGIGFDTERLAFVGAAKGDLEMLNATNFGLSETAEGRVRMLWFTPDEGLFPMPQKGDVLFYLSFQAKKDIADAGALVWLDDNILPNRSFASDGEEGRLVLRFAPAAGAMASQPLQVRFFPNPFSAVPAIEVEASKAGPATLWLFDAFGGRLAYRKVVLAEGLNTFALDEAADLPKGVYIWKVKSAYAKISGVAVKQ